MESVWLLIAQAGNGLQTVDKVLMTGMTALVLVIRHLYYKGERAAKKERELSDKRYDECDKDRTKLWRALARQHGLTVEQTKELAELSSDVEDFDE